jgi:hypothetical protein
MRFYVKLWGCLHAGVWKSTSSLAGYRGSRMTYGADGLR